MERRLGKTGIMTALLLMSMALMVNVPEVEASGTIYIRADGSIDPSTAPIQERYNILSEPPTEWNKTYGGAASDYAHSVVQTSDGGYAIAGATISYGAGYHDFWLVKVVRLPLRSMT